MSFFSGSSGKMGLSGCDFAEFYLSGIIARIPVTDIVDCSELCRCDLRPLLYMSRYSRSVNSPGLLVRFGVFYFEYCSLRIKRNLTLII